METLIKKLEVIAWNKSKPFCYSCYKEAPSGTCSTCLSDDLMRITADDGPEYGVDWIVKHLVETNLKTVDTESAFEESVAECYPETVKVGWMELDAITVMKTMDPLWWKMAISEHVDNEVADDQLVTFDNGNSYYRTSDLEDFIERESA